jgi:hypothetical protein
LSFYSRTNNNTLLGYDSTELNLKKGAAFESKNVKKLSRSRSPFLNQNSMDESYYK